MFAAGTVIQVFTPTGITKTIFTIGEGGRGRILVFLTIPSNGVGRFRKWWLNLLRMTGYLTLMRKKCKAKSIPDAQNSITWQCSLIFSVFCSTLVIDLCSICNCRGALDECLPWLLQNVQCWERNFSLLWLFIWFMANGKELSCVFLQQIDLDSSLKKKS